MRGNIVILGGGPSAEREVSIRSAMAVFDAMKNAGEANSARLVIMEGDELPKELEPTRDILFLTTHGTFGEDGQLQAHLDEMGFIYTGACAASSAVCFNKHQSRLLAERSGLKIAEGFVFTVEVSAKDLWNTLGPKIVLKPNAQGSSVGLHIVESLAELEKVLPKLTNETYLAEKFIEGRELTIGVLNGQALAPVEIIPDSGVYDYKHKYTSGMTRYECPAKISEALTKQIQEQALKVFNAASCRDFARIDFRLGKTGEKEELVFLEINTLPGLTATSLLPKSAAAMGYDFPKLIQEMLKGARARYVAKYAMAIA